jgi:Domain of unknown function (DUF4349)
MKMRRVLASGASFVFLVSVAACGQKDQSFTESSNIVKASPATAPQAYAVDASSEQRVATVSGDVPASSPPPPPPAPPPPPGEPPAPAPPTGAPTTTTALLLAYSYSATLSLPADNVTKVMKAHESKCVTAGPALCQVVTAASQKQGDDVSANLSIRATPTWLGTFRTGLDQDAKSADGKVEAQGVTSEDLTRNITDSEARLRALKSLRVRIEALIASRPGKLSDLLEAERELARVQGEIDSFESNLSVMRARVNMSTMDLAYQSRQIAVGGGTFEPLGDAITGFFGVMARSLASLITFLAAILPFGLVLVPVVFYGLKWRAKRAAAKTQSAP